MNHNTINKMLWLVEQDLPGSVPPQPSVPQQMPQQGGPDLSQGLPTNMGVDPQQIDVSNDPVYPDMPEESQEDDYEIWKIKFIKESIKGDPNVLIQKILSIRDHDLTTTQIKFVEDNLDICQLRQNSNILNISNEIRKMIKTDFDRTNPATTLVRHITSALDKNPLINEVYIKLLGLGGSKGDQHRKFVSALIGGIQVGSGAMNEDVIFEERDYSIRISTRCNSRWGDINLGRWFLKEDDPQRYLKPAELDRLQGGSPEEKDVLRRRVIIESIAENYLERAFVINVIGADGTIYHLGWDLGNSLKSAYLDGKLVVRTSDNDTKEAFIDEEGTIISIPNLNIYYVKEAETLDQNGQSDIEEIEFIQYRDGTLYLSAQLDLIKEAAMTLQGITYKETLWQGNPSDIKKVMRCVPGSAEILLRTC